MKYYLVAGEASGDLHASNLMAEINLRDPEAEFRFWGGPRMQSVSGELVQHYRDISFMGFWEVLKHARKLAQYLKACKKDIVSWQPDVLVPVDFPGFNLRLTKHAARKGIPVCYYISPQVWAWKSSRVKLIKKCASRMITILPFEKEFYARYDMEVDYVGHPLIDVLPTATDASTKQDVIAILPGSRQQEIVRMLPIMLSVVDEFPSHRFVVCGLSSIERTVYSNVIKSGNVQLAIDDTASVLAKARAAIVKSGTSTLEAALHNTPQVVCYKGGAVSYWLGRRLVKVKHIALVNIILGEAVVKELIQGQLHPTALKQELAALLTTEGRDPILESYKRLRSKLGGPGASARAAEIVIDSAKTS